MLKRFIHSRGIELRYDAGIAPAKGLSQGGRIAIVPGLTSAATLSASLQFVQSTAAAILNSLEQAKEECAA